MEENSILSTYEIKNTERLINDQEWPEKAANRKGIEMLFLKMVELYGNEFINKWRVGGGSEENMRENLHSLKITWAVELKKNLSSEQFQHGFNNLVELKRPPNLPEFIAFCRGARRNIISSASVVDLKIEQINHEKISQNRERLTMQIRKIRQPEQTADWAFKILMRGKTESGLPLPYDVEKSAKDAVYSCAGRQAMLACTSPDVKAKYLGIYESVSSERRQCASD